MDRPITVHHHGRTVEWTDNHEANFQYDRKWLMPDTRWAFTPPEVQDSLRSAWYHGYITAAAGAGSY